MSTEDAAAEAAASLFGGDDSASDLFASLGTEPAPASVFDTSADLHFSNSTASDVFPVENTETGEYNPWPAETTQYASQQPSSYQPDMTNAGGFYAPPPASTQASDADGIAYPQSQEKWQQHEPHTYVPPAPAGNSPIS
jgi:hypothetical protein